MIILRTNRRGAHPAPNRLRNQQAFIPKQLILVGRSVKFHPQMPD
jgi:hypothetical protein